MRTLVILDAYDPGLPGVRTFYLTSGTAFITTPSETPASQTFAPVLSQPLDVRRRVQSIRGGAVLPTVGDLRIDNQDGTYDAWLGYAFDGRAITVRVGPDTGAYPADYPVVYTGQVDRCDVQGDAIVLRVRDAAAALDAPLQTSLYLGDNVPPDGLEGGAELEGRPKPLAFGVVRNVPLIPVNTAKLIYQVSDSALDSVDDVYDSGVALGENYDFSTVLSGVGRRSGVYADGQFVLGGDGATKISTSPDGTTWTNLTGPSLADCIAMTYGDGLYVVGGAAGALETSPDATTWTARTSGTTGTINGLAYGNGVYVLVSDQPRIRYSADAVSWSAGTTPATTPNAVAYSSALRLFCVVGNTGLVTTSPDGATWTVQTSGTTDNLSDVHWGGDTFVATSGAGTVITSPDGIRWTTRTDGVPALSWTATAYVNGRHLLGANDTGAPLNLSDDGIKWVPRGNTFNGVSLIVSNGRRIVLVTGPIRANATASTYASLADLEDDSLAPVPGTYKWIADAAGTYVRLGSAPFGTVTADATHGATAADRTAGQIFTDVLTRAGYTSADWNAGDITALDTADASEIGLFIDDDTTVSDALDAIARTVGAWWAVDADGDFRIQQLTAPSGSSTFSITANDIRGNLERLASSDPLLGRPSYRTTLRYALADSTLLDGTVVDTDTAVQTTHLLAEATVEDTLYTAASDAQAEATRRQTLRGTARSAYRVTVSLADYAGVDVGDVGTLQHPRFGLSGGVLVRVLGVEPDARNRSVTLTLWR